MSDSLYNPDQAAVDTQTEPWSEAFRAQRDVGLLVPINYLTTPAVSLRAACFSRNQYEDSAFQKCFSNLLAIGLRRFRVDVYWDAGRSVWSLCPAEIPPSESAAQTTASATSPPGPSGSGSNARNVREAVPTVGSADGVKGLRHRQEEPKSNLAVPASPASTGSSVAPSASGESSSTPSASPISFQADSSTSLREIGDYKCTSTVTLSLLTGLFEDFLDATATTTDAAFMFLLLDIHAAASWARPNDPAQQPPSNQLPATGNLLRDIMKGNLSDELYVPDTLRDQRANLNESWYDVVDNNFPALGYYQTSKNSDGTLKTENGWPTEAFIEFSELRRLISGFGTIDPQMAEYNVTADSDVIFPPGVILSEHDVAYNDKGGVSSGCFFAQEETVTSSTNNSWAFTTAPKVNIGTKPNLTEPITEVTKLTSCGLSFLINSTISNVTADENPLPYAAYVHSQLWSWAPGEPLNATNIAGSATTQGRCAAMYATGQDIGRWRTVDCSAHYHVACQDPSQPFRWTISETTTSFFSASSACPTPLAFSVPHTALENAQLLAALQSARQAQDSPVLVNLNSLDVAACWITTVNGTCPYLPPTDTNHTRLVVVPTVAAVMIFVLAALTFFVKCAANRREDKRGRRRRMVGGWEYEGVPS